MKYLLLILLILSGCATVGYRDMIVDPKHRSAAQKNSDINDCTARSYGTNLLGKTVVDSNAFWQCIVDKGYLIQD